MVLDEHLDFLHATLGLFPLVFLQLSFGGMPYSGKPHGGGRKNFKGCMESINYNGDNITDLARRKKLDTSSFVSETLLLGQFVLLQILINYSVCHNTDSSLIKVFLNWTIIGLSMCLPPVHLYCCFTVAPKDWNNCVVLQFDPLEENLEY